MRLCEKHNAEQIVRYRANVEDTLSNEIRITKEIYAKHDVTYPCMWRTSSRL